MLIIFIGIFFIWVGLTLFMPRLDFHLLDKIINKDEYKQIKILLAKKIIRIGLICILSGVLLLIFCSEIVSFIISLGLGLLAVFAIIFEFIRTFE